MFFGISDYEVCNLNKTGSLKCGKESDIWALGIIAYILKF
jgi:hypothetical protein